MDALHHARRPHGPAAGGRACAGACPLIHLSVAVGRFVEALFYAILSVAGVIAGSVVAVALAAVLLFMLARWMIRRNRKK